MSRYNNYAQHIRATRKQARIKLIQSMIPNLIHTPRTMTIPQYARYESERNLKLLIRFWWLRFIPVSWLLNQIENFTTEFNKLFNPESGSDLYRQIDKLIFENKLMIMNALYNAIFVHLEYKGKLEITRMRCGIRQKPDPILAEYFAQATKISGVEIKKPEDIKSFRGELERSTDKFEEMFAEKKNKTPVKSATIDELWNAYSEMLPGHNRNYHITTLAEFATMKNTAEQKYKKIQEQIKKK